ncbi:amino acid permease [Bacillus sp. Marseille-P3661]|uniref:amino acid permease n=1 Tax=Bacillus sp. Marseille-P3661 TaxID=1936234 RepID=UPI0015E1B414|nr:amino acid permease [Bacillus sp. Marseille-P3661]
MSEKTKSDMKWWQLSLFGVGATIGTGFFLGTSIGIRISGPAVLLAFLVAALGTYFVFDALARMTSTDPQKGAFRTYAKKAFGPWAGFTSGWIYWSSELLIMGSQLTALSIFTRFWFPDVPLWVLATAYAILALIVLLIGVEGLNRVENLFAIIKIAAIIMFIVIASLGLFGVLGRQPDPNVPTTMNALIPVGIMGLWSGLIYAFYAFGGIEVMGLMASRLKNPKEAPKAGKVMLLLLTIIYLLAVGLALTLTPWRKFTSDESPFIFALDQFNIAFVPHVFNAALIIAGFSTMAAALYAITTILVTLAEDHDAPAIFAKKGILKVPTFALLLIIIGLIASIVTALVLPGKIYEYITTAAGLMLLYNWLFILASVGRIIKLTSLGRIKQAVGMILILAAVTGTILEDTTRPGFFISLSFVLLIGLISFVKQKKSKKNKETERSSLFEPEPV